MRVIDANSGAELREGLTFRNVNGAFTVLAIRPGIFSASAVLRVENPNVLMGTVGGGDQWANATGWAKGQVVEVPLIVRYFHPSFFLQRVGFLPS